MNWSWKTNLRRVAGAVALFAVGAAVGWFLPTEGLLLVLAFLLGAATARVLFLRSSSRRTMKEAERVLGEYHLYLASVAKEQRVSPVGDDQVPGEEAGAGGERSG